MIGSLAMANSGPDTNGSQFFIITGDNGAALPPSYNLLGLVVVGLDTTVADMNAVANPDSNGVPNITAYAFHLNPAGPSPAAAWERLPRFIWAGSQSTTAAITWMLPAPLRNDVRFTVHESTTLAGWTQIATRTGYGTGSLWTGTVFASISDSGSPLRTVIVPASQPSTASTERFLRLTLEKSSGGGSS